MKCQFCYIIEQKVLFGSFIYSSFYRHGIEESDKAGQHIKSILQIIDREKEQVSNNALGILHEQMVTAMKLSVIFEILYEIAEPLSTVNSELSRDKQVFTDFIKALSQNYKTRRNVTEYAEKARLSVKHFSMLISRFSGHSPKKWIVSYVMSQAKFLLTQDTMSIKEVSEKLRIT